MTRNIRKVVSIICAVAILLSISVISFTGSSSAMVDIQGDLTKPTLSEEVNLTFQGEKPYGIPLGRYAGGSDVAYTNDYAKLRVTTGWYFFGKDGSVGQTAVAHNATGAAAAKANLYKFTAGNTYSVSFKYKVLAGASIKNRNVVVGIAADPTAAAAKNDSSVFTGLKTSGTAVEWNVNGVAQTGTLTADTDWQTVTAEFTAVVDGYFGFQGIGVNGEGGVMHFALDDVVISKVTGSYGVTKITHDMENDTVNTSTGGTANGTIVANNNAGTSVVDSGDAKYGKVLNLASDASRFTVTDSGIFTKGKKYYISFDAKSTDGTSGFTWISLGLDKDSWGNISGGSKQDPRVGIHSTADVYNALKWYVNGAEVKYGDFVVTANQWNHFGIVIDLTDAAVVRAFENVRSDIFAANRWFYIGRPNSQFDNFEIITLDPTATPGYALVEEVVDGDVKTTVIAAGSKYTLTTPANTNSDRGFKCWVDANGNEIADPNNYIPAKGFNKVTATWTNTFVRVTYVNGSDTSAPVRVGVGSKLLPPEKRPNANLFFQGWVDADGKVYTEVPDKNITLYAKYNGTILTFDKVFAAQGQDQTGNSGALVADPDNAQNSVLKMTSVSSGGRMFTLPAADFQGAGRFELKTNTTYTYSIKYKVAAGAENGSFQIVRGNGVYKERSLERTVIPGVNAVKVSASDTATEWRTVTGTFTTGDSHYLERVYWYYQNNLILKTSGNFEVYFDDIVIAEVLDEAPEGAVAINFKTNGLEIPAIYGFPGEEVEVPAGITNGSAKFLGWYTDKKLSVPYTETEFGTEDITLYAKWDMVPFVMDLENYDNSGPASRCHLEVDAKGNHYFNWNSEFNPSQSASTMYSQQVNGNGLYCTLIPGVSYKVTFDYKLIEGSFNIGVIYNNAGNGWSDRKQGPIGVTLKDVDDKNWKTASYTFTADCPENLNYLSFGVAGNGNCYFDNIIVESSANMLNLYGSSVIMFNTTGGNAVQPIAGDPGELIGTLPSATRAGYLFDGWYTDTTYMTKFTEKTFNEEGYNLCAKWIIGKFNENFEDFPKAITLAGGYKLYNSTNFKTDFDKANVQSGDTAIFRSGATTGDKAFTICREDARALTVGKQYTVSFYVKPTNVGQAAGTISLISMDKYNNVNTPSKKDVITTVGELKAGEWQKVSYTFTATDKFVGISTSTGNDMYLDNFTVTLKGYTGTTTGDNSVNPMLIVMMIVLAAGALTVTGKKVFEK